MSDSHLAEELILLGRLGDVEVTNETMRRPICQLTLRISPIAFQFLENLAGESELAVAAVGRRAIYLGLLSLRSGEDVLAQQPAGESTAPIADGPAKEMSCGLDLDGVCEEGWRDPDPDDWADNSDWKEWPRDALIEWRGERKSVLDWMRDLNVPPRQLQFYLDSGEARCVKDLGQDGTSGLPDE